MGISVVRPGHDAFQPEFQLFRAQLQPGEIPPLGMPTDIQLYTSIAKCERHRKELRCISRQVIEHELAPKVETFFQTSFYVHVGIQCPAYRPYGHAAAGVRPNHRPGNSGNPGFRIQPDFLNLQLLAWKNQGASGSRRRMVAISFDACAKVECERWTARPVRFGSNQLLQELSQRDSIHALQFELEIPESCR